MLVVEPYDGSIDLLDYLEGYKTLMILQDASNALLCLAFPATLKKTVQTWYSELQLESFSFFE